MVLGRAAGAAPRPPRAAFDLASKSARGEREFHAVFEAEPRRVLDERDVFGSAGSVPPSPSSGEPKPFQVVADAPLAAEPAPGPEPEPEPQAVAKAEEHDRAALALAIGALRFRDGRSPAQIQDDQGIDPTYYVDVMHWLAGAVDATLDGDYPAHLDRERLAAFAAGLEDKETSAAIESHTRGCPGCATNLADLLDGLVRMVQPAASGRRRAGKPVMRVRADELRRYAVRAESRPAARPTPTRKPERVRQRRRTTVDRHWRRTAGGVALLVAVALAAVLVAIDTARTTGSDPTAGDDTPGVQQATLGEQQLKTGESPLGGIFPEATKRSPKPRAQPERSGRRERPHRRSQPPATTRAPSPPAPAPASPPPSSAPAAPPPPSPPPPQSPPPSSEFGLEP